MNNVSSWGVSDWAVLVGSIAGGLVLVINAMGQWWGHKDAKDAKEQRAALAIKADSADRKLDVIHDLTNSNMSELKRQLAVALQRIESLEASLHQERNGNT